MIAAVGTLVAIRQGAGDIVGAARLTQAGLWLAWLMALVAGAAAVEPEAGVADVRPDRNQRQAAGQFLMILPFALPGYLSFMALRGFTSAIGRATPVMVISLGGTVANFLLNYALITGMFGLPKMGLVGIGLVTAIVANLHGRGTGAAHSPASGLRRLSAAPGSVAAVTVSTCKELWRLGLPIGGTYAVEVGLFAFAALCMGTMGSTQLARASDRAADRLGGVHGSGGAVLRDHHAHRPALRRRATARTRDWPDGSGSVSAAVIDVGLRRWCSGCCRIR